MYENATFQYFLTLNSTFQYCARRKLLPWSKEIVSQYEN